MYDGMIIAPVSQKRVRGFVFNFVRLHWSYYDSLTFRLVVKSMRILKLMSGNAWIIIGVVCGAIALFAVPYGFHLKSSQQSQEKIEIKQETNGEQSPNIISETTISKGSISQKSSGSQSPNIISGEGNLEVTYGTSHANRRNADKEKKK